VRPDEWSEASIGRHLHLTAKAARAFHARRLAEAGSSYGIWTVLASLRSGGPMIQRELAERMSIEGPTLARYLNAMESDGLIRRRRSETDRRAATVELTREGTATFRRLEKVALEGHAQLLRGFTADEVAALGDMLTRIERNTSS
jgi:MarR family transcriptional regulator for hemolysin